MTSSTPPASRRAPNPWWVGAVAGMASYLDSAAIVSTGLALVIYQDPLGITPGQIAIASAVLTFGIAVGSIVGGRLGDRFGRRHVFLVTMAVIASGATLLALGDAFPALLAGAALVGLGVGADLPVSLAAISEASSRANRGATLVLSNMLWTVGILGATAIGAVVGGLGRVGGQILFGHLAVVAVVVLLLRLTIPESASWTAAQTERRRGVSTVRADRASVRDLLRPQYAGAFLALIVFYTLTNLAANTGGQFNPLVAENLADVPVEVFARISLVGLALGIVASIGYLLVVDGRKRIPLFVAGGVLLVAGYSWPALFGFSLSTMAVLVVLTNIGGAFAFEGIMKVWTQESFPTMLRASAQGAIVAVARISAALLALFTPALLAWDGRATYALLALLVAVGLVVGWLRFHRVRTTSFDVEDESVRQEKVTAA